MRRGMKPTTTALTFLPTDEFGEVIKSSNSLKADLFSGIFEKEETSQQLPQDWDLDLSVAGRAQYLFFKVAPALGKGR